jgi:hypothetical protein
VLAFLPPNLAKAAQSPQASFPIIGVDSARTEPPFVLVLVLVLVLNIKFKLVHFFTAPTDRVAG